MVRFVQSFYMRTIILFLAFAGIAIITWLIIDRPGKKEANAKAQAISISKHTPEFNEQIAGLLNDYNKIAENFVSWDSAGAMQSAATLIKDLDNIVLGELKKDSTIYLTAETFLDNAKGDAQTIMNEKNIRQQREAFSSLTDNLYQFLNTVKYDKEKLYLQECPMAFDDTKPAQWLSQKEEIRNPYLGLHHPTYGKGMLKCGEIKATMNNTETKQ